jgi:hypothetical protein
MREEQAMFNLKKAEADVASLEQKRAQCVRAGTELSDERSALSFAAHANGDAKAKARLEVIHDAISKHASELQSVDAALRVAAEHLERAKQDEAAASDRKAAKELRKTYSEFVKQAERADELMADFLATANAMKASVDRLHSLGHGQPNSSQFLTYFSLATHSINMFLPWARSGDFRHLSPNERRTFAGLVRSWAVGAENNITARLGEQKETEHANV